MKIADIIKELRKEKKLTQKELAQKTGIGQSTIAELEKGKYEPTAGTIKILATFFNVSADYLLGLENEIGEKKYNNSFNNTTVSADHNSTIKF